jgi:hypothetical protein
MPIVRECFGDSEPAHDDKRNLIDNTSLTGLAKIVCNPGVLDVFRGQLNQFSIAFKRIPKRMYALSIWATRGSVATFPKYLRHDNHGAFLVTQSDEHTCRSRMPLVSLVPRSDKSDRVDKDRRHG